jgi:glycosyltransferase involved in cell wall biosynthesis
VGFGEMILNVPAKRLTVSVIIPTFNRAQFVGEAIDSLLSQTRPPDEIIVVDDGSTDHTIDVLAARYGSSIITITQPNAGLSAARNTGLRAATGDLLAFLDSDDSLPRPSIERRAQALEKSAHIDVVYSNVLLISVEGKPLGLYTQVQPGPRPSGMVFFELARRNLMPVHAFMFRRRCLDEVGLFDEKLKSLEDYDFWLRMAARFQFEYLDEPLACYRVHSEMMTAKDLTPILTNELTVHRRIFDMPAFERLTLREKSRVYVEHGNRLAMLGQMREARYWYARAIRTSSTSPRPYLFAAFTMLGRPGFERIIKLRMRLRGDLDVFKG